MPEQVKDKTVFSLFEITQNITQTISETYRNSFWIKAEMNKINFYQYSGHCYPELVDKLNGKIIAQMQANIWKEDFVRINNNFISILKEPLKDGIKILFCAKVTFHSIYGLKLTIIDIDPSYSLGELEREKSETIERIKNEGIYTKNKEIAFPLLPKRIAIISVETSKGYSDFVNVINEHSKEYKLFYHLFPAILDGEKAINSIINQLMQIKKVRNHFDAVAIIRGGGGEVGLSCYNNYLLSKEVAIFPIPVLTGIGHSTNKTVVELVAFESAITPTKLAEFIIQKFQAFSDKVSKSQDVIVSNAKRIIEEDKRTFNNLVKYSRTMIIQMLKNIDNEINEEINTLFHHVTFLFRREWDSNISILNDIKKIIPSFFIKINEKIKRSAESIRKDVLSSIKQSRLLLSHNSSDFNKYSKDLLLLVFKKIKDFEDILFQRTNSFLKNESKELSNIERIVNNMNPKNVIRRGFSITLYNGKVLNSIKQVKTGDILKTIIDDGNVFSNIKTINKPEE